MASIIDEMAYVKRIAGAVEDATVSDEQFVISRLGARTGDGEDAGDDEQHVRAVTGRPHGTS